MSKLLSDQFSGDSNTASQCTYYAQELNNIRGQGRLMMSDSSAVIFYAICIWIEGNRCNKHTKFHLEILKFSKLYCIIVWSIIYSNLFVYVIEKSVGKHVFSCSRSGRTASLKFPLCSRFKVFSSRTDCNPHFDIIPCHSSMSVFTERRTKPTSWAGVSLYFSHRLLLPLLPAANLFLVLSPLD